MSDKRIAKISVIGLGYIGLPTAAMFASKKISVLGVDVNEDIVSTVNSGSIHIEEPMLPEMVSSAVADGFLRAALLPEPADAFIIAVPTPFQGTNHEPDLSFIRSAIVAVARVLEPGNLVVLESTSPIGTTEIIEGWLATERPDLSFPSQKHEASDVAIAYCPERVLPGSVINELTSNDRVIGGMTKRCSDHAVQLYKLFVNAECVVVTNPRVAEASKLAENSFRDVNIAFANELSMICDETDINIWELIQVANRHPRVNILNPGPGVGGHCIAVDPWFLVHAYPHSTRVLSASRITNDEMPNIVVQKVMRQLASTHAKGATIGCLGLAYKKNIGDARQSPAVDVAFRLQAEENCNVLVCDPFVDRQPFEGSGLEFESYESCLAKADLLVLLVDHDVFLDLPSRATGKPIIDTRGMWESRR